MASHFRHPTAPTQRDFHTAISRGSGSWYAASLRITRNSALAEDAVQDGLLNAWSKRRQFHGGARLETWIHRVVVNSALTLMRRDRRDAWTEFEDLPDDVATLEDARAEQEVGRDLESAIRELSEFERVCFVLKHLEQWRLAEIADRLETGVGPVKQALFRALGKLRVSMAELRRAK